MKSSVSDQSRAILIEISKTLLESQGEIWLRLEGSCMWPIVRQSDRLKVERVAYAELKFGDVAIFQTSPETFHANTIFRNLKAGQKSAIPGNYFGKVTEVERGKRKILLETRGFLRRLWQVLISPANPYGLNFPKSLWKKIKPGKP